jgi:hypothetical protein
MSFLERGGIFNIPVLRSDEKIRIICGICPCHIWIIVSNKGLHLLKINCESSYCTTGACLHVEDHDVLPFSVILKEIRTHRRSCMMHEDGKK